MPALHPSSPWIKHLVQLRTNTLHRQASRSALVTGAVLPTELLALGHRLVAFGLSAGLLAAAAECDNRRKADVGVPAADDAGGIQCKQARGSELQQIRTANQLRHSSATMHVLSEAALVRATGLPSPPPIVCEFATPALSLSTFLSRVGIQAVQVQQAQAQLHHHQQKNQNQLMKTERSSSSKSPKQQRLNENCHRWLVLDRISDPGNMGVMIRTAHALGWGGLCLIEPCVDPFNDKCVRASAGSVFSVPIIKSSWETIESMLSPSASSSLSPSESSSSLSGSSLVTQDFKIMVADTHGTPLHAIQLDPNQNVALVLASEADGPGTYLPSTWERITIPMHHGFDSLNVSVASGILMYALRRF